MISAKQSTTPIQFLLIVTCGILLFGCSSTRHLEKKQRAEVYAALGLEPDKKDNYNLYREAASWLHVPHVDGGTSKKGTDCSFFVQTMYQTVYNISLERNSGNILKINCRKIHKNQLREGDIVFFSTSGKQPSYVNHVGIYLKENKFIHASTSKGVMVSDLDEKYWKNAWVCGGRVK